MYQKNNFCLHFLLLFSFWAVTQLLLLWQYGIVTGFEANKYIEQADYFLENGHYATGNFLFYSTEILLIAACKKFGIGYWPVIGVQFLFNAISVYCFYYLALKFTNRAKVAFWFTVAFLCMYYYHLYNVHLFTESLYFSFSIIIFYGLNKLNRLSIISLIAVLTGLVILYLTRPVGLFFIVASFLFLVLKFFPKRAVLLFLTAGIFITLGFIFLLNRSLNSGGELDFLLPYLDERIICGVPTINTPHKLDVPIDADSVQGLFYIITNHWELFFKLSVKRLLAFFGVLRSYYSLPHNIFIGIYFYSIYIFSIMGSRSWSSRNRPQVVFIMSMVFLTALTTALSCDEWHNRFILAIVPFLLLLASLFFAEPASKKASDDF
ncbi:MAG: hypothetical protein EOO46_11330 [Flavobacterium sp.]|nr:MAG: hypothetical protein EOO46_11330 [Flavobacterium sp.]